MLVEEPRHVIGQDVPPLANVPGEDLHLDLARLALERGPHLARARGPVLGKAAAFDREHVVFIAGAAKDQPAGLAERLFERVRTTVLAGNGGKHDPAGLSPQVERLMRFVNGKFGKIN